MRLLALILFAGIMGGVSVRAYTIRPTIFERELTTVNYGTGATQMYAMFKDDAQADEFTTTTADYAAKRKSPGKAFALSLLVPGAGQLYYGSKIKAVGFLGVEVASWILYSGFHSDGNDLTDKFNQFNDEHWSETRYSDYLYDVYGYRDDDSINAPEISHHLPDTKTQQYYEMSGKYDQFSWGWDDAELDGKSLDEYHGLEPKAVVGSVPYSANRLQYEDMRASANKKFDEATKMIIVASINHVVSAFEAFISTKRYNSKLLAGTGNMIGDVRIRARLKSFYARHDTPYVTLSCRF